MAKKSETMRKESAQAPIYNPFAFWITGETPLICHAWSEKARREMLDKQLKVVRAKGKTPRDPEQDFVDSLYELPSGGYGFPVTGVKKSLRDAAHKDKGINKTDVGSALWLNFAMISVRTALAGAICDLPLIRIHAGEPQMREDMVRFGSGVTKTSSLAYRGQFWPWAMKIVGRVNTSALPVATLSFLVSEAGRSVGLGEWRPQREGIFGCYRQTTTAETEAWEAFAKGEGPLPAPTLEEAA